MIDDNIKYLGIDEAGRGSVLGSMFMAGVLCEQKDYQLLSDWQVKDSKIFGSSIQAKKKRKELADKLKQKFSCYVLEAKPEKIDSYVARKGLNILERQMAMQIIKKLKPYKTFLDGKTIFGSMGNSNIIVEDKADDNNILVSAASILAKDARDRSINKQLSVYKNKFGKVAGGGYANKATLKFIEWHYKTMGKLPMFYRHNYNYKPVKELIQ